MKYLFIVSLIILTIGGCASRPGSIRASHISHERFIDGSCAKLATQMSDTRHKLAMFSGLQDSKATGDAWSVFLLGFPFSQLTDDYKADVAKFKGMVEAIETAQIKNKCK